MSVVIETTVGDFTVDLFLKERPRACQNFLKLCKLKYYNFCLFHTIQRDFIAQTGDPDGTGKGGTSLYGMLYGEQAKYFEAEKTPKLRHQNTGTLSFASHGDHMLGSQFFVTLAEDLRYLDSEHCVFGQVVEGLDVLVRLNAAICDDKYQPYQDIRITHTVVLDDPLDDPAGLEVPDRSPPLTDAILSSGRIAADEDLEDSAGRTAEELEELIEEREARARATILEMVGDLPDADSAPPENVLFVCKLNPVTTDDDLQVIFSRFGKVMSCEIIRDQKTGNSLQYGFIEFDNPKSCENAYFKMDNVLIDDRRIHVDFSQSVSKVRWRGRGRVTYESGTAAADLANFGGSRGGRGRPDGDRGRHRGPDRERRDRGAPDRDHRNRSGPDRDRDRGGPDRERRDRGAPDRDRSGPDRGRRGPEPLRAAAGEPFGGLKVDQLKALLGDGPEESSDSEGSSEGDQPSKKAKKKKKKREKKSRKDSCQDGSSDSDAQIARKKSKEARRRSTEREMDFRKKEGSRDNRKRSHTPDVTLSQKKHSRDKRRRSRSPDIRSSGKDNSRNRRRSSSPEERPSKNGGSRHKTRRSSSPVVRPSRKEDRRDSRRRSRSPDTRHSRREDPRHARVASRGRRSRSTDEGSPEKGARDRRRDSPSPDRRHSAKEPADRARRRRPSPDDVRPSRNERHRRSSSEEQEVRAKKKKHRVSKDGSEKKRKKKEKKRRRSTSTESSSSSDSSSDENRRKKRSKR